MKDQWKTDKYQRKFLLSLGTNLVECEWAFIHTCDLLGMNYCINFSVHAISKKGTQPIIELSVHAKVDQIANVNAPTW